MSHLSRNRHSERPPCFEQGIKMINVPESRRTYQSMRKRQLSDFIQPRNTPSTVTRGHIWPLITCSPCGNLLRHFLLRTSKMSFSAFESCDDIYFYFFLSIFFYFPYYFYIFSFLFLYIYWENVMMIIGSGPDGDAPTRSPVTGYEGKNHWRIEYDSTHKCEGKNHWNIEYDSTHKCVLCILLYLNIHNITQCTHGYSHVHIYGYSHVHQWNMKTIYIAGYQDLQRLQR